MNKLKDIIELIRLEKEYQSQIRELNIKLDPIKQMISEINEKIPFSRELYEFLCYKILETYTKEELERIEEYRKVLKQANTYLIQDSIFSYNGYTIFDPFNDSWYIYDYEQEGDNIRFLVSCRKNEGSIIGMMQFLDTHYTNWIKISDLETFDVEDTILKIS